MLTHLGPLAVAGTLLLCYGTLCIADEVSPTFNKDVALIIFTQCMTCHRQGQIGPFALTNYQEVNKRANQIVQVTERRLMPPWMPSPEWGEFKHQRRLSDEQIVVFKEWVDAGKPEGDAGDLPPRPLFKDGWQLGKPDLVLKMPNPFAIPAEGRDVYMHYVFPLELTEDRYLRGIEVIPGNMRVAHHAVGILDASGIARRKAAAYDGHSYPGNAPGFLPAGFTPGFVPGQTPAFFGDGEAITLKKGTDLILQMHYHPSGREEFDETSIGLYFTDTPPKRNVCVFLLGSVDIDIPPGEKAYKKSDSFKLPVDFEVGSVWSHMHLIGKEAKVWAELPDKTTRNLLRIDDWDFNWQDTYQFKDRFVLPAGTIVRTEFTWDNSSENPRNPFTPPQRIVEGEQSTNEMGGIIIGGLPVDKNWEWLHWAAVIGHYLDVESRKAKVK